MAEFDKGREMSRDDVATVLRGLPKFSGRAVSTVDDVAKKILGQLVHAGSIIQTRKSAKSRPALYRKADVRKASA